MSLLNIPLISTKKALLILIVSPILLFIITFLSIQKPTIDFLTTNNQFQVYSDKETGRGKSEISSNLSNKGLKLNYILKEGDPYPFVAVAFIGKNYEAFDTDGYFLNLSITSDSDHEFCLRIGMVLDGYTKKDNLDSYIFVEKSIPVVKGSNHFKLSLNDFIRTPSWWYTKKGFSEFNLPSYSRKKSGYISIYDVKHNEVNINRNIEINEFEIHPTYNTFFIYSAITLFIYGIFIYLVYIFNSRKPKKVLVPIDLSLNERKEKNYSDLIVQYIALNFSNSNLKLEDIAKEIGLSENQISLEIKNFSGRTFKSYLNFIRIEKAKILLMESDLQVSEIAYEVGYNSAHHFIRVFKELEDTSPTIFRKDPYQKQN